MPVFLSSLPKPVLLSKCNGCGYCCSVQPCAIAQEFLGAQGHGVCPALERDSNGPGVVCGMIVRPLHYLLAKNADFKVEQHDAEAMDRHGQALSSQVAQALGAGKGCDADDDADSAAWPWPVMLAQ